ncbi:hypothetical protein K474DRAFT_715569 [Panus rudis PR-1116 ss-1]|nr:hypothetical protein K474DRAFT_715569 [Panus rudis PR-1116 ss-1]
MVDAFRAWSTRRSPRYSARSTALPAEFSGAHGPHTIFLILLAIHEQVALGPWLDDPATHPRPRRSRKLELVITKFLVKLRQLWKVIWQYRDVFIPPLNTGRRRFLRPTSGEPMECTVSFMLALQIHQWNERYKDYKPNADSWDGKYALRILLFLWVQADYAPALKFYMREATAMLATCECHALRPMVGDAVLDVLRATTNPDGSSEFMRSACDVLLYEETILDDDLEQILHLLDVVQFVDYHTFMQVDEDMVDCDLLAAITTCCQRQLCCGDPSYDFNIISSGVLLVGYLVQTPGSPFLEIAKEDLIGHKFLPIVARGGLLRILDYDHEPSNRDYLLSLTIVLEAYYGLIREMLRADPEDPEVRTFRRIFRTVWYPTLKGMERLSLNFQPEDRRWGPIQLWIAIGGLLGLTVDQEAIDHSYFLDKLQRTFPRGRTRRCHWRECLCAHEPSGIAPHRIRTCNGCRSVYYCSTRCQAKDWEEGDHRDECRHMRLLESC